MLEETPTTRIRRVLSPKTKLGNDPNDNRHDPDYMNKLESLSAVKLNAFRASSLAGCQIPEREWAWDKWATLGSVTGLGGPPGVAKSYMAQQINTHIASGIKLFGSDVNQGPSLHISCEDDEDELKRRQIGISAAMGLDLASEVHYDMHLMSWAGDESLLCKLQDGVFVRQPRYKLLDEYIGDNKIRVMTLDLIPDFWNGNEIIRTQVNEFVKTHLGYLARRHKMALIPIYHPSLSGMRDGTGTSGSTAWEGSYRARIFIKRKNPEDKDCQKRIISREKSNYSQLEEIEVYWKRGYLWMEELGVAEKRDEENVTIFLNILHHCESIGIDVSPSYNSQYYYGKAFPALWKKMDGRHKKITRKQMETAFIHAQFEGVIRVTERTKNARARVEFIGYHEAKKG